jgi:hypothetical protein
LIVKSEIGLAWGGKTFWILQDNLVSYISKSTALDIHYFIAQKPSEVNILAFSYGDAFSHPQNIIELSQASLYAEPIRPTTASHEPSFLDMVRSAIKPPVSELMRLLSSRAPINILQA